MADSTRAIACLCTVLLGASLSAGLLMESSGEAHAQQGPDTQVISDGKGDYEWQCASCHGPGGKGDGPMAKILVTPPTDLTTIAKKNGGVFPFWRIYRVISGKTKVPGHEAFQMPDFWKRFSGQAWEFGLLPPHVRILELTHYVESLQQK